jgi:hypothetical protein
MFYDGAAMFPTRSAVALAFLLVAPAGAARADDAAPPGCTVSSVNIVAQDMGDVAISCSGLTEAFGQKFAEIMTRILQDRLDPQTVLAKLDEVDRIPGEGVARTVDENQRQMIIRALNGKPVGQIAITAHPLVDDSAEFAKAIATSLLTVGWQIEGHEIRRAAPKSLDPVTGLAIVVRDRVATPQHALQLKAALNAAHITASWVTDPALAPDATLLWVGRRPVFMSADPPK